MDPKVKYDHYEKLIGIARELLPTLDRIVPAAAIVAKEQTLSTDQQGQLKADIEIMEECGRALNVLQSGLSGTDTQEALFVRAVVRGGLNNLLLTFYGFANFQNDPEYAGDVKRKILHPYLRLYSDIQSLRNDSYTKTRAIITIDGEDEQIAGAYYKTAPLPDKLPETSEAVYGLVFSALLLSGGEREISLNFTARAEGVRGFLEIENKDGIFANHLSAMIDKPEMQPTFLEQVFAAGMNVHGTTIRVPFQIARMV